MRVCFVCVRVHARMLVNMLACTHSRIPPPLAVDVHVYVCVHCKISICDVLIMYFIAIDSSQPASGAEGWVSLPGNPSVVQLQGVIRLYARISPPVCQCLFHPSFSLFVQTTISTCSVCMPSYPPPQTRACFSHPTLGDSRQGMYWRVR